MRFSLDRHAGMQFEHSGSRERFSRESKTLELSAKSGVFHLLELYILKNLDCLAVDRVSSELFSGLNSYHCLEPRRGDTVRLVVTDTYGAGSDSALHVERLQIC